MWHDILYLVRSAVHTPLLYFCFPWSCTNVLLCFWKRTDLELCIIVFSTSFKYSVCSITYSSQTSTVFFFPVLSGSLLQLLICSISTEDCRLSCTFLFACTHLNELFLFFARDGALSHFHERLLYHSEVKIHLRIEGVRVRQHSPG